MGVPGGLSRGHLVFEGVKITSGIEGTIEGGVIIDEAVQINENPLPIDALMNMTGVEDYKNEVFLLWFLRTYNFWTIDV